MNRIFKNPTNGYTETIPRDAVLGVSFFGALYLASQGLWKHAFLWICIAGIPCFILHPLTLIFTLPLLTVCYACSIKSLLEKNYLRNGWVDITKNSEAKGGEPQKQIWYRKCPFCAEEVLAEAIKCKHCHSELPPVESYAPAD